MCLISVFSWCQTMNNPPPAVADVQPGRFPKSKQLKNAERQLELCNSEICLFMHYFSSTKVISATDYSQFKSQCVWLFAWSQLGR